MAPVDNGRRGSKGDAHIAGDTDGNARQDEKDEDRKRNHEPRSHGFWTESMDLGRQNEQHMGESVPNKTHRAKR